MGSPRSVQQAPVPVRQEDFTRPSAIADPTERPSNANSSYIIVLNHEVHWTDLDLGICLFRIEVRDANMYANPPSTWIITDLGHFTPSYFPGHCSSVLAYLNLFYNL